MNARRKPTPAEAAKTLVCCHSHGVLSTLSTDGGYPFGSVVDYVPLEQGDVVVLLNERAEHFRYIRANPKSSILINPHLAEHEATLVPRVTLLGKMLGRAGSQELVDAYLTRHPDAEEYIEDDGLQFMQLDVTGVRFIQGASKAVWLDLVHYRHAAPDPLGNESPWLSHRLNHEFQEELLKIAHAMLGQSWAVEAGVASVDRYGVDLVLHGGEREQALRVSFEEMVSRPEAVTRQIQKLFERAQAGASSAAIGTN